MSQPAYNDIVISNFTAAANPHAEGCYSVIFESFKNKGELRIVEVTESGAGLPEVIPECENFSSGQRLCVTYFGDSDIALFYIGGQSQGELYLKVRENGTWADEKELKVNKKANIIVGQGSYISCTISGKDSRPPPGDLKFDLYFTQETGKLTVASGGIKGFWVQDDLRIGKDLTGEVSGRLVAARGPHDTLLVYTDKEGPRVICQQNGAGAEAWTPLAQIKNAEKGTPLAANLQSSGKSAGVFNVFYRKIDDQSGAVSVARRSREPVPDDALAFSTTDLDSNFAAVTLKYPCGCCTGTCKCSRPAQRFLAVSKRDSHSTLFQYHKTSTGRWIIPCGLIITNSKF